MVEQLVVSQPGTPEEVLSLEGVDILTRIKNVKHVILATISGNPLIANHLSFAT